MKTNSRNEATMQLLSAHVRRALAGITITDIVDHFPAPSDARLKKFAARVADGVLVLINKNYVAWFEDESLDLSGLSGEAEALISALIRSETSLNEEFLRREFGFETQLSHWLKANGFYCDPSRPITGHSLEETQELGRELLIALWRFAAKVARSHH